MSNTKSSSTTSDIKDALRGVKGVGDAIRGSAMESVDSMSNSSGSKASEAKNHAIAERGAAEARAADNRFGDRRPDVGDHSTAGHGMAGSGQHTGAETKAINNNLPPFREDVNRVDASGHTNANVQLLEGNSSILNSKIARSGNAE